MAKDPEAEGEKEGDGGEGEEGDETELTELTEGGR